MKRVASYSRKDTNTRTLEIWNAIGKCSATKGHATLADIAKEIKMTRSSHLRDLAMALVHADQCDLKILERKDAPNVYHFYFSEERLLMYMTECPMLWDCGTSSQLLMTSTCFINTEMGKKACPIGYLDASKQKSLKTAKRAFEGVPDIDVAEKEEEVPDDITIWHSMRD